jgi:hypothetical protein
MTHYHRLSANPIISPETSGWTEEAVGFNINGPSLIAVPDWIDERVGRYYLYFAHHQGKSIRMAYADRIEGPWTIHTPGTLQLDQTPFEHHIASPDLHVDEESRQLIMYYHGCYKLDPDLPWEQSAVRATSQDGLRWETETVELGESYFRVFTYDNWFYAIAKGGRLYRSRDGRSRFEICHIWPGFGPPGPGRHWAALREDDKLHLWFSRFHDSPEHIKYGWIDLTHRWTKWKVQDEQSVLRPEHDWEGVNEPIEPSQPGAKHHAVHELRDPAIFRDPASDRLYLLYSTAGERGIAIAEVQGLSTATPASARIGF